MQVYKTILFSIFEIGLPASFSMVLMSFGSGIFNKLLVDFSPDIVFHLAAQPLVGMSYEDPVLTWSVNVMGTINVLEALRKIQKKIPILVYGREYWNEVINFSAFVKWGMISESDLDLFHFVDTPDEAVDYIQQNIRMVHSVETDQNLDGHI